MSYACMLWFNFILVKALLINSSTYSHPVSTPVQTLYFHIPITWWTHSHEWPQTLSGFTSSILALLLNYRHVADTRNQSETYILINQLELAVCHN